MTPNSDAKFEKTLCLWFQKLSLWCVTSRLQKISYIVLVFPYLTCFELVHVGCVKAILQKKIEVNMYPSLVLRGQSV